MYSSQIFAHTGYESNKYPISLLAPLLLLTQAQEKAMFSMVVATGL